MHLVFTHRLGRDVTDTETWVLDTYIEAQSIGSHLLPIRTLRPPAGGHDQQIPQSRRLGFLPRKLEL